MYKVLIADEEDENIKKFKSHIKFNFKDTFKVIKTITDNSVDILELIGKIQPELIITNVRFFGVNSYKLKDIHSTFNEVKFILYGDINDIEYLEYSASFGSLGYIIKPVRAAELTIYLNIAKKYLDKILKEREDNLNLKLMYEKNINLFETYFLNNLLKGIIKEESEIINNFNYFNISINAPYTVVTIHINEFKKKLLTMDEEEKHLFVFKILQTVRITMLNYKSICLMNSFNAITLIIGGIEESESIMRICENIKEDILHKNNTEVSMGIGRTYQQLNNIYISYNEAEGALKHRFYMGYSTIIPIEYVEPNNTVTYRYNFQIERKLVHTAVAGEFNYCKILLKNIFNSIKNVEPLPERLLSQIVVSIIISIGRHLSEQNILKELNFSEIFSINKAMNIKNINEAYDYLHNSLEKFCRYLVDERKKVNLFILKTAKESIKTNYHKTISLNKIAKQIGTTPGYLNNLFLLYEGKSYYDFVVNERLLVAKKFIKETDLTDSAIAVNIGYIDERYFRSIFRQYEKMTTEDYRILHKQILS